MNNDEALLAKQQRFVEEYLIDCNATAAAVRAGYEPSYGRHLLMNPNIARAIEERQSILSQRTEVTQERCYPGRKKYCLS